MVTSSKLLNRNPVVDPGDVGLSEKRGIPQLHEEDAGLIKTHVADSKGIVLQSSRIPEQ